MAEQQPNNQPRNSLMDRGLPASPDVERLLLGLAMIDEAALLELRTRIEGRDFALRSHQIIYDAILEILDRGDKPDRVVVAQELMDRGQLDAAGGLGYLVELDSGVPPIPSIDAYVRVLRRKSLLRRIALGANVLLDKAIRGDDEPEEILARASGNIMDLAADAIEESDAMNLGEIVSGAGGPDRIFNANLVGRGIPTGFEKFDKLTGGLQPGELLVIGARPSMGKTSLVLDMTRNVSAIGYGVMGFSLEMTKESLLVRMCCSEGRVRGQAVRTGTLNESEREQIIGALARLVARPIYIDDSPSLTMLEVQARIRRYRMKAPVDVAWIDYLGLCRSHERNENRTLEIGNIAKAAKQMAKDLGIPVVLLSQLSRACEARADKRPILSDLRESGDVEAHADTVAFLYREAVYAKSASSDVTNTDSDNRAELIIRKQRNGPIGTVNLNYFGSYTRFD